MFIELKEKLKNLNEIRKTLLTPKMILLMVWLSILPVGLALMWRKTVKMWMMKETPGRQTKLNEWEASKSEKRK